MAVVPGVLLSLVLIGPVDVYALMFQFSCSVRTDPRLRHIRGLVNDTRPLDVNCSLSHVANTIPHESITAALRMVCESAVLSIDYTIQNHN